MLQKYRIKTRLLISFAIVVLFTLIVGITGYISLVSLGKSAVKTMQNLTILNDIYDYNLAIDTGVFSILYISDFDLTGYVVETTKEQSEGLTARLNEYLGIQNQFSDVFTPGEMQDMVNLSDVFNNVCIPVLNEIFDLTERGRKDEALSVAVNQFYPIYDTFTYYLNVAFIKNLEHSKILTAGNNKSASTNAYLMVALALMSLIVSILLAFAVTRSIAVPLSKLETVADRVANSEINEQFDYSSFDFSAGGDEITHLSLRFQEALKGLAQVQRLKIEAAEAQYQKEKEKAASRAKSDFLAKMSHEIRTPMNAITGMAELALREDVPNSVREHILTIKQASANLLSIINDILDFSKIESGKLEIIPTDYLFSSLLNDIINIIRMRAIDSQLKFVVNIDGNIPGELFGDEIKIRQVFLNILNNAVKYTEKGHISLTVTGETTESFVNLTVKIADSGKGIKQEDIGKLFGNFVQINLENNKGIEGTGLGLAIAQGIVKAMDGNISIESEYGKGSTFTVTLPQKIHKRDKLASVETPNKKRTLVYGFHEIYANSIAYSLDNLGVDYAIVSTSSEFCEKIEDESYSFVFINSDLYESVRNVCAKFESKVKIVLLTEFGKVMADQNLSILTMPVHSVSIANILNGVTTGSAFSADRETTVKFTLPSARILIVDDIYTNLKVAEGLLAPYNAAIDICLSGAEAVELVKKQDYDLVFMDHMMPDMDGIEATERIRSLEEKRFKTMPIIALTANAVSGMREIFLEKGFNDFLTKPIDISKLSGILTRWVPKDKREQKSAVENGSVPAPKSPLPIIPGVDVNQGIAMTGGTYEGYLEVLSLFCEDAEDRLVLLKTIPDETLLSAFTTQVHSLKSVAASIGAANVSMVAALLEAAGQSGDIAFIQTNLKDFTEDLSELVNSIRGALIVSEHGEVKETPAANGSEGAA